MNHPLDPETEPVTQLRRLAAEQSLDGWYCYIERRADGTWKLDVKAPNSQIVLTNGEGWGSNDEERLGEGGLRHATAMAARLFPTLPIVIDPGGGGTKTVIP